MAAANDDKSSRRALRSDAITKGVERAPHRSLLKATGVRDEDMSKPFVAVVGGAMMLDATVDRLHSVLSKFEVNVVDTVRFQSKVPPCFKCGRHRECEIGGMYKMLGEAAKEVKITQEMFSRWEDDHQVAAAVDAAAAKLKNI